MSCRILVTDDDELVLLSVQSLLESEGYAVATAASGQDALDRSAEERFDLFLLDIIMPGLSGLEVCKALRAKPEYRETPIVMLTAKSAEADRQQGMEAGATRFLPKPIQPERLIEVLREVCAGA